MRLRRLRACRSATMKSDMEGLAPCPGSPTGWIRTFASSIPGPRNRGLGHPMGEDSKRWLVFALTSVSSGAVFLAMRASWPAARPAHALDEFRAHALDVLLPRLRFLHRNRPADPLIAGQRSDVLPCRPRGGRSKKGLLQIRRYFVHGAAGEWLFRHSVISGCATLRREECRAR